MKNTALKLSVAACSRRDIEDPGFTSLLSGSWFVISIYTPGSDPAEVAVNDACKGILLLCFDDLDRPSGFVSGREENDGDSGEPGAVRSFREAVGRSPEYFREEWAEEILSLVDGYGRNLDTLIVQCEAGVSRSAAIAAGLCVYTGKSDSRFFRDKVPNRFVYRTMIRAIEAHSLNTPDNPAYYRDQPIWKVRERTKKDRQADAKKGRESRKQLLAQSRSRVSASSVSGEGDPSIPSGRAGKTQKKRRKKKR